MARFSFSTGILSPLNSDISLNDVSAFSFGSLPSTPDCDKGSKNLNKYAEKDSDLNSFFEKTMKESATTLQVIASDVKRQSDINAEREEKFKESYDMLKQSMDELFYNKACASFFSPISKDIEKESFTCERKLDSNVNTDKTDEKVSTSASETWPEISNRKTEMMKKSFCSMNTETKNDHLKNIGSMKLSTDNTDGGALKLSMDELIHNKAYSSILSPVSQNLEKESFTCEKKLNSDINTNKANEKSHNIKDYKKASTSTSKTCPKILNKKTERKKKEHFSSVNNEQKNDHKNISLVKLPTDNTNNTRGYKHKTSKIASAPVKSLETKQTISKKSQTKCEARVKDFEFKCQQKIAVSNNVPVIESKKLSIEKSVEILVGMQMDSLRSMFFDQHLIMQKELFKLQDMAREQAAATNYLLSVVDQLTEENKKLLAKHK